MLKIIFLGDDKRSKKAVEYLTAKIKINATLLENENQLNTKYDVYIFPIPASLDNELLNNSKLTLKLSEILENIPCEALLIGGGSLIMGSIDVAKRDDFSYQNAIPTAEGAIALAINHTDITLSNSKILITGFGRVSKILIQKLSGLCKDLTVALRNKSDTDLIDALGFKTIPIEKIAELISEYDIIINTIPFKLFNKEVLSKVNKNNLFIELASNQLGFDTSAIEEYNINYINAPGLPNKVAPTTAAYVLADTITNILEEKNLL